MSKQHIQIYIIMQVKLTYAIQRVDNLNWRRGDDVNIEFIFRWGAEEKTFDVHLSGDIYAEEK